MKSNQKRIKFEIPDSDVTEAFIKGMGPGGQKTNKSNNCVLLTHIPTGIIVKVHDSRL
jgi:protein subunit release factor B